MPGLIHRTHLRFAKKERTEEQKPFEVAWEKIELSKKHADDLVTKSKNFRLALDQAAQQAKIFAIEIQDCKSMMGGSTLELCELSDTLTDWSREFATASSELAEKVNPVTLPLIGFVKDVKRLKKAETNRKRAHVEYSHYKAKGGKEQEKKAPNQNRLKASEGKESEWNAKFMGQCETMKLEMNSVYQRVQDDMVGFTKTWMHTLLDVTKLLHERADTTFSHLLQKPSLPGDGKLLFLKGEMYQRPSQPPASFSNTDSIKPDHFSPLYPPKPMQTTPMAYDKDASCFAYGHKPSDVFQRSDKMDESLESDTLSDDLTPEQSPILPL